MKTINNSVQRILQAMFQMGLFDRPNPGNLQVDARSPEHTQLARIFAAQSTVVLKNDEKILPLGKKQYPTIAIIGDAGNDKPVYVGFGSGSVIAETVVTPLQGIRAAVAGTSTQVLYANTSQTALVQEIVQRSDLVIVFIGTEASEGYDRPNLNIPADQNRLVEYATQLSKTGKVIVVLDVPGAVLMPWLDKVQAVVAPFMSGQEDGNALADVLYGEVNPAARLPITFPKTETEIPPNKPIEYPGINNTCLYEEGFFIGYRWYDQYDIAPLFPFGHGLSYTTFKYNSAEFSGRAFEISVSVSLTNTGPREGAEVVQLYIGFPTNLGEPPKQLKGFSKINLQVNE